MRGAFLNFQHAGGPVFDFTKPVADFSCLVQNALVNVATDQGSDPIFPDRGTTLKQDGAIGRMVNTVWATQAANFAALSTLAFIQQTDVQSNSFKMQSFTLRCQQLSNQLALLAVQAVCTDGTTIGIIAQT